MSIWFKLIEYDSLVGLGSVTPSLCLNCLERRAGLLGEVAAAAGGELLLLSHLAATQQPCSCNQWNCRNLNGSLNSNNVERFRFLCQLYCQWLDITGRSNVPSISRFLSLIPCCQQETHRKTPSGSPKVLRSSVARRQKAFRVTTCWRRILAPGAWHLPCAPDLGASISGERMATQKQAVLGLLKLRPGISLLSTGSKIRFFNGLPKFSLAKPRMFNWSFQAFAGCAWKSRIWQ